MRKKIFSVKCPEHILFGDPLYFEEYSGKRLESLVVDYSPYRFFEARVVLNEERMEEFPEYMMWSMTIYLAPKQMISIYMDGKMFESQGIVEKEIGVDTARYIIEVDGRREIIHTGGDGYWGSYEAFYRKGYNRKIPDAVIINIGIPDSETFESMEHLTNYFFEDVREVDTKEKRHKKEEQSR